MPYPSNEWSVPNQALEMSCAGSADRHLDCTFSRLKPSLPADQSEAAVLTGQLRGPNQLSLDE
ncbi:MAG: hypothetical protein ACO3NK_03250, partial [Prochlorotrichaceae cyanobacterium]